MNHAAKFAADEMLGRLAKWLRILGFDTVYRKQISDYELLALASRENRIILTRDRKLRAKSRTTPIVEIHEEAYLAQAKEVLTALHLPLRLEDVFSLCLDCNVPVDRIPKEEVSGKVPPYVWQKHDPFHHCPQCGKIYWGGSHYGNTVEKIKEFLK